MTWARQICKLVIYCSVVGFVLALFAQIFLPLILNYLWQLPASPSKSLEAILSHRIELRNLEGELNVILRATSHPVNDHGIPGQKEIEQQFDEYFDAIEDYTKDYGKFDSADLERFVQSHEKISKRLDEFVEKHEQVRAERNEFLMDIAQRVTSAAETITMKSVWTLLKHFDTMAKYGVNLDVDQLKNEFDDENSNPEEDEECFEVLQKLLNLMNEADQLSEGVIKKIHELNAQLTEEALPETCGSKIDVDQTLNHFHQESKRLNLEMFTIINTNRQLLGKTNSFISAAAKRLSDLGAQVIEKEDVWREEMNAALIKLRDKSTRSSELTEKLTMNVNLRIAPDLDQEANDHTEL